MLAGGEKAALFGLSATAAHNLRPDSRGVVDLVTPTQRRSRGMFVFHAARLDAADLTITRAPRHPGRPAVETALSEYHPLAHLTKSMPELAYLLLITTADLPTPRVNQLALSEEVDFHWPDLQLVVEIDGPDHDTAYQRAKDHARDALLRQRG